MPPTTQRKKRGPVKTLVCVAETIGLRLATGQVLRYDKSRVIFMHISNCSDTQYNNRISCNYSLAASYWSAVQL
jgi:hypothetical protein